MNQTALSKIKECLQLASEFVKDENSYNESSNLVYPTGGICITGINAQQKIKKRSDDLRAEAEQKASRLEKQEKCAKLIIECLEYVKTVDDFENEPTISCGCQNK